MNLKKILLLVCITIITQSAYCQKYALDKNAFFISGMGTFASQGGDLYEDFDGNRLTTIALIPSVNYFVTKNFFIGAGLEFSSQSQDDEKLSTIGIGPQFGYAIGNENSTVFPYIDAGIRYNAMMYDDGWNDENISGTDVFLGAGLLIPIKEHFGLNIEGSYHMTSMEEDDFDLSGNTISISFGFVGFIF